MSETCPNCGHHFEPEPARRTVWTVRFPPDRVVRLEDIPASQLADAQTRTGANWLELVGKPLADVNWSITMYEKACTLVGVDAKDLTVRQMLDSFDLVDDDRPDMYVGGLPDPKAGELTTAG